MVAAALLAWRGAAIPRTPLELPVLVLLVVLGLATLASQNLGLSARSLATSVTWALLLPVAIAVVARRPAVAALTAIVPVAALAAASLASMIATRAAWFAAGAPGLPPVRLSGDSSPFGSVAIAPFVLAACLVLTLLIDDRRVRLWAQAALILLGLPLTVLSGSRSAWLALAVTAIAMLAPAARRLRIRPRPPTSPSAVAGWLVWRAGGRGAILPLAIWVGQLVSNAVWSWLFFGLHRPPAALADIVVLLVLIVAFAVTARPFSRGAAGLFVPYAVWVLFAASLNAEIVRLNPSGS